MKQLLLPFLLFLGTVTYSQNPVLGKWKTIDDETHKTKSIVKVYEQDGKVFGKVMKTFPDEGEDPDPICGECDPDDPRYKQKIIGMVIMQNMEKDDDVYSGGKILDPENGNVYRCKIWEEDGKLFVRGYLGFFYRTQEWLKIQ